MTTLKSAMKKPAGGSSHNRLINESGAVAGPSKPSTYGLKVKAKQSIKISQRRAPRKEASDEKDDEDEDDEGDVDMESGDDDDEEPGTDEEIERSKSESKGSKKSTKRKRAPTTASDFGATLTSLLADPLTKSGKAKSKAPPQADIDEPETKKSKAANHSTANVNPILALSAHKPPTKATVSLEAKARRQLKVEKEEKEDKARVRDVLEGWSMVGDGTNASIGGQDFERGLRKVAQRGVIKLFNAILVASKNAEEAHTSLSAQAGLKPDLPKGKKEKDNILGRGGKEDVLTKESFLDLVRKGSTR